MSDILSEIDEVLSVDESEDNTEPLVEESEDGKNDTSTDEADEGSEGKDEDPKDTDKETDEKPKRENGVQKRINELTREKYELRRELDELRKRSGNNEPRLPEKPAPGRFQNEREYRDAVIEYNTTVKHIEAEQVKEQEREAEATLQRVANKVQSEKVKFKDFDAVVSSITHIQMDEALTDVILNDQNGIDILYFLGKNPSIAEEISTMSQTKQARTLGILSAKLESKKTGKQVSGAPKPPSKVSGSSKAEKHPGDMSPDEYAKWRSKQK